MAIVLKKILKKKQSKLYFLLNKAMMEGQCVRFGFVLVKASISGFRAFPPWVHSPSPCKGELRILKVVRKSLN